MIIGASQEEVNALLYYRTKIRCPQSRIQISIREPRRCKPPEVSRTSHDTSSLAGHDPSTLASPCLARFGVEANMM
jgi:hypothetical protein